VPRPLLPPEPTIPTLIFRPMIFPPYAVEVSIPITTTLSAGVAVGVDTTINLPASNTMPVRSSTPLATISASYSMYSPSAGVAELATAMRMSAAAELLLFTTFTVTTLKVFAGTVYRVVSAVVVMLAIPNLPVAILFSVYVKK
jgi:hypothetical protein